MEFCRKLFIIEVCIVICHCNCIPKDYGNGGTVCVCNATYCDYIDPPHQINNTKALVYTSNLAGLRFHKQIVNFKNFAYDGVDVNITDNNTYQEVHGFGGAFTDATGINIGALTDNARKHLLRSYFSSDGIEYNLCRVPIGGTDFSTEAYSYDDGEPDPKLKKFALNRADTEYKIPYMILACNMTKGKLRFFASAWTAPKWMKTNEKYVGGSIKPEMYQTWADYHVKFFDAYKKRHIKFWGVTTGNEPSMAKFPFAPLIKVSSVGWTPKTMATWVAANLGPALRTSSHSDLAIIALDDQRYYLPRFMDLVFKNEVAKKYINGTAVHWYWDKYFPASLLSQLHKKYPEKFIISTEACKGAFFFDRGVKLGSWSRAEDYATDIIEDLLNWATGWIDWNMALNTTGGPTYINNQVDSPIIVNGSADEFYKQPMFYAMGHFSKFISRGSVRIDTTKTKKVSLVAFKRPDNAIALVILNKFKSEQNVAIADHCKGTLTLNISSRSITSVLYWYTDKCKLG